MSTFEHVGREQTSKLVARQVKVLLREAPAVVVKEWETLRRYQAKLKQILAEMVAGLPKPVLNKMRSDLVGFCPAENLDCPEILKLFGRP